MSSDGTTRLIFTLEGDQQSLVANFGAFLPVAINGTLVAILDEIAEAQTLVTEATLDANTAIAASAAAALSATNAAASEVQSQTYSVVSTTQANNAAKSAAAAAASALAAAASAAAALASGGGGGGSSNVPTTKVFDLVTFYPGVPPMNAVVIQAITPQVVTYPAALPGSFGVASVPATATTTFTINRIIDGAVTSIGTAVFEAFSTTATFTLAADVTTNAGDVIQIVGPAIPDQTLANINFALTGSALVGSGLFDVITFYPNVPSASAICMQAITPQPVTFPLGLTTSYAVASIPATAPTTFTINWVSGTTVTAVGTAVFAEGGTLATFTFTSAVVTAAGDIIQIVGPSTPDATLANVSFALVGSR